MTRQAMGTQRRWPSHICAKKGRGKHVLCNHCLRNELLQKKTRQFRISTDSARRLAARVSLFAQQAKNRYLVSVSEEGPMTMEDQPMTYAIGDLHGEVTLLRRLLALLPIREEDMLVFLGDCLDRGEDSVATILALRELKRTHPACIFLRGNHEDAWLACWNGVRFTHVPDIEGALQVWDDCDGLIPFAVGDWLEETRIEYEDEYAYYVHAGLLPGKSLLRTSDFYKMWGVKGFLESQYDWGKPVVFGHWNLPEPLVQLNKIGIDTGAFRRGTLTAVRLPDRQIFQVQRES